MLSNDFNTILLRTLVTHKAPRGTAWQAVFKKKTGTDAVLCLVKMRAVGAVAVRFCYDSEELLKQIELVRGKVIEVASACNIGLKPPRKIAAALIVEVAGEVRKILFEH